MIRQCRELWSGLICVCLGLLLGSCASNVIQTERMLSASGFKMKFADDPDKMEQIAKQPQQKLVPHGKDGKVVYVYADSKECKCIYLGDEKAYQAYQKMAQEQQLADEQLMAAEMDDDALMDWGVWGPWH